MIGTKTPTLAAAPPKSTQQAHVALQRPHKPMRMWRTPPPSAIATTSRSSHQALAVQKPLALTSNTPRPANAPPCVQQRPIPAARANTMALMPPHHLQAVTGCTGCPSVLTHSDGPIPLPGPGARSARHWSACKHSPNPHPSPGPMAGVAGHQSVRIHSPYPQLAANSCFGTTPSPGHTAGASGHWSVGIHFPDPQLAANSCFGTNLSPGPTARGTRQRNVIQHTYHPTQMAPAIKAHAHSWTAPGLGSTNGNADDSTDNDELRDDMPWYHVTQSDSKESVPANNTNNP